MSARTGQGIDALQEAIARMLPKPDVEFVGVIPYSRGDLVSRIHLAGKVLDTEYLEEGTSLRALVREDLAHELKELLNGPEDRGNLSKDDCLVAKNGLKG